MSNVTQEIVFIDSGLNTDTEQRWIPLGDAPYRLNVIVSGDGAQGVLVNMHGNTRTVDIVDHQLSLSHTYVTVGSFYNRLTRKCYYFIFSQPYDSGSSVYIYDNKLFCYNEDTQLLDLIFTDIKNWFGLDLHYPMRDCAILEDWLYFNPRTSEPKMIDVVRAYNYTNYPIYVATTTYVYGNYVTYNGGLFRATTTVPSGSTPSTNPSAWERMGDSYRYETELLFDSEFEYAFNVIKMPPVDRPAVEYGTDTYINTNNLRGIVCRFAYRYKYFDNSYSVYSALSDVTLPENDELYNGAILNDISVNNYLNIRVSPHSPALVKEIEIVFQEISGDWKRIKIINRQEQVLLDTIEFSFNFYNNESYLQVPNINVAKIEDSVPQKANSQEIINKNILTYGGCLEGFANIPKDEIHVGLTPVLNVIGVSTVPGTTLKDVYAAYPYLITYQYDLGTTPVTIGKRIDIGSWYPSGVVDGSQLIVTIDGITRFHTFTTGENSSKANYITVVSNFLADNYPTYRMTKSGDYVYLWSPLGSVIFAQITQFLFCTVGATSADASKRKGFKTGANHPFCIFYYDENKRRWDAQTSKENIHVYGLEMHGTTVYVPMFNEVSPLPANTAYRWTIDWEVYHLPPVGAKYWKWGYSGNSLCSKMVQYIISSIIDTITATDGANMCKIDITPLQTLKNTTTATWNQYPTSVIDPYEWQAGDRVRFITEAVTPSGGTSLGDVIDGIYDFEILKQDGDSGEFIYVQHFDFAAAAIGENTLIEIYTPLKSITDTKNIFYEFGNLMTIEEDSAGIMVHMGQNGLHNQDTALSHAAMGSFDGGDIYHITRTPSKPLDTSATTKGVFHESMWYSDFYNSDDYDRGKIGFETTFGQRFLNVVRYSNQFIANTLINGLPTFEGDHFKELNDVYGDIMAIYEQGDTLKVYQERKASSILIGRTEYYDDGSGKGPVAISTSILGAIRYSPSNYATVFPESISRNNKYIYGFDIYNGVVWRDSPNGLFPISGRYAELGGDADYKMQTYFKLKAKALLEGGIQYVDVLTAWDEEYKNLFVTFRDSVHHENNETVVFHEPSNRWICFASFEQSANYVQNVLGGYNVPLEPDYEIITGFLGGIGYVFNNETRFAEFHFTTTGSVVVIDPTETFIVDEDNTTFVIDDVTLDNLIE
jgi:hypothetical protein